VAQTPEMLAHRCESDLAEMATTDVDRRDDVDLVTQLAQARRHRPGDLGDPAADRGRLCDDGEDTHFQLSFRPVRAPLRSVTDLTGTVNERRRACRPRVNSRHHGAHAASEDPHRSRDEARARAHGGRRLAR